MLTGFDWLRRCSTGAELLATLELLNERPELFLQNMEQFGPPLSALTTPCLRCWIYPQMTSTTKGVVKTASYCQVCKAVRLKSVRLGDLSRRSVVIWGWVNQLPQQLRQNTGFKDSRVHSSYVIDDKHFMVMLHQLQIQPWLREMVIYHGAELTGFIQIFPTTGAGEETGMGDIFCRAISHETSYGQDRLRVRFYTEPYQIMRFRERDRQGILDFDAAEFLNLLDMVEVFRTVLYPDQQAMLFELLALESGGEEHFYWGRFLGALDQPAKDMLNAWRIRQWPPEQIKLFYELREYVVFTGTT